MLKHEQQRALLEYLEPEFSIRCSGLSSGELPRQEFIVSIPPTELPDGTVLIDLANRPEIEEKHRAWSSVKFSGFKWWEDPCSDDCGWVGQIIGQRSDGQFFYENISWKRPDSTRLDEDPEHWMRARFESAYLKFQSFRDCSCGIIGHKETGELDKDGDPITIAIHSPCKLHNIVSEEEPANV